MREPSSRPLLLTAEFALDFGGALHRLDDAGEFGKQPVARPRHDAAVMALDDEALDRLAILLERGEGARLVHPHHPAVSGDVGAEDGGELAFHRAAAPPTSSGGRTQAPIAERTHAQRPKAATWITLCPSPGGRRGCIGITSSSAGRLRVPHEPCAARSDLGPWSGLERDVAYGPEPRHRLDIIRRAAAPPRRRCCSSWRHLEERTKALYRFLGEALTRRRLSRR